MLLPDPVKPDGPAWAKILDFGIAKVRGRPKSKPADQDEDEDRTDLQTGMGAFMGTALYMAPEQHGGAEAVDGKADVFALGVTVYEMLAGKRPFRTHAMNLLANAAPPLSRLNASVSTKLESLVQRMMALEVADRPTMAEVLQQLTALSAKPARPKRRLFALAALGGFALGALVVLLLLLKPRTPTSAEMRNSAQKILIEYLQGQEPPLRVLAARALGQSRDLDQRPLLEPFLQDKGAPPPLVSAAAEALGQIEALESRPALLRLALDKSPLTVQLAAAGALSQLRHPQGGEVLKQLLSSDDKLTQIQTALTLLEHRDGAGAQLLWSRIERSRLDDSERIKLLGGLAQTGDDRAKQKLTEELNRLSAGDARVIAAYHLGALDDEAAGARLKAMASRAGPEQLLAARLLASLGVLTGIAELEKTAANSELPDAMRELAIVGLSDGAQSSSLIVLWKALSERGASPRLRIAAAGAILRITAGERARLAEHRLRWARAAIGSDSASTRELAVSLLGDLESEQAVVSLGQALRDEQASIRETAATLLGRRPTRAALQVLSSSLSDRESSVRVATLGSIGRIIKALQQRGDSAAKELVLGKLRNVAQSGSEADRVVASIVLISVGEGQPEQHETVRRGLQSKDARVRRLVVERIDPDREVFTKALSDSERGVRTYAALRLAALKSRDGIPALKEAALRGDLDGLKAYGALLRLGETVQPPPALAAMLRTGDLPTRRAVLEIVPELPPLEARNLLQLALLDAAPTTRRQAVDAAAETYRRRREPALIELLRRALNDPALPVRSRAVALLDELTRVFEATNRPDGGVPAEPPRETRPRPDMQADTDLRTPASPPPNTPQNPASKIGVLICEGDELVPVQIDKRPWERIIGKEISLVGGSHVVRYLGGERKVVITPDQTTRVRIPVARVDLRVQSCRDALRRKDLQSCQDELDALRREQGRRPMSAAHVADSAYLQGQIYESRGQLDVAIQHYNKALNVPATQRPAGLNGDIEGLIHRLASKVGRVQIFKPVDGRCEMVSEFISPPGETVKSLGPGKQRRFYVRAGATTQDKDACK